MKRKGLAHPLLIVRQLLQPILEQLSHPQNQHHPSQLLPLNWELFTTLLAPPSRLYFTCLLLLQPLACHRTWPPTQPSRGLIDSPELVQGLCWETGMSGKYCLKGCRRVDCP